MSDLMSDEVLRRWDEREDQRWDDPSAQLAIDALSRTIDALRAKLAAAEELLRDVHEYIDCGSPRGRFVGLQQRLEAYAALPPKETPHE